jgi:hypothetical protein
VLHEGTGRVVTPRSCDKRELARACERANIPRVATWLKQSDVDSAVVSAMMGHSSTAMVDRVYGKLDASNFRRAMARLPGADLHAGVTHIEASAGDNGAGGTHGAMAETAKAVNSDEESTASTSLRVRAEGLEPSTSGLGVPAPPAPNVLRSCQKLRLGK